LRKSINDLNHSLFREGLGKYLSLHALLFIYSLAALFSKMASSKSFMSFSFLLIYTAVLVILVLYAFGWQQILKKMPLSIAYVNKSVTVIWGFFWGGIVLHEKLTAGMLIGTILVISGIFVVVSENE
jgi:drug/metabolite transporter (DMT)-like permease